MEKESLDSSKVNYLIWRYLIESDYQETAIHLQKEWNQGDPQQLPFANHVTNHALVSVLNKGLQYNAAERESARTTRDVVGPVSGFFGPLSLPRRPAPVPAPAPAQAQAAAPIDEDEVENARKRQIDEEQSSVQNNSSKRPRLSNGYENGFDSTPKSPMDVDEEPNGDGNAYPSPEQLPSPAVVTIGPEKGTQMDKVTDLSASTTFVDLSVSDDSSSRNTILLQCEFNPRDPMVLAAAGTDALARMWNLPRATAELDELSSSTALSQHNLLSEGLSPNTIATGLSWAPDGYSIAVASEPLEGEHSRVEVWHVDGTSIAIFEAFESPIIALRWNLSSSLLLTISPDGQGTVINILSPATHDTLQHRLPDHYLMDQPLDATWTSNDEFVLCAGNILMAFTCIEGVITQVRKYETRESHGLSKVAFDMPSRLLATATETGTIDIWDQQGRAIQTFNAHQGMITSLIWQPIHAPVALNDDTERLLGSAGEDGAISIWNARSSETKSRSSMTMDSGVVALAFTPDGAFIAGATSERILVWKVGDVHIPRASWIRGPQPGWQTPQSQGSGADEDQHSLCWDANGQKLAYGVNGLLAIINFQR